VTATPTIRRTTEEISVLNDRDATIRWSKLFRGQDITTLTLEKAESLLDELSPESPVRHRFAMELEELQRLHQNFDGFTRRRKVKTEMTTGANLLDLHRIT